jgi:hypothetical protein
MKADAAGDLARLEAMLRRAVAVGRLGPKAPARERESARTMIRLVWLLPSAEARQIVLTRLAPDPRTGDGTGWPTVAANCGVSEMTAQVMFRAGLAAIAAELRDTAR